MRFPASPSLELGSRGEGVGICYSGQTHVYEKAFFARQLYGTGAANMTPCPAQLARLHISLTFRWAKEKRNMETLSIGERVKDWALLKVNTREVRLATCVTKL